MGKGTCMQLVKYKHLAPLQSNAVTGLQQMQKDKAATKPL